MKRVHETSLEQKRVEGSKGFVDLYNIIDEFITAGIRIVAPYSDVPARIHEHPERQIIYLIEGKAQITNTKELISLEPGDFVILEADEEHYIITGGYEVKIFEVKF